MRPAAGRARNRERATALRAEPRVAGIRMPTARAGRHEAERTGSTTIAKDDCAPRIAGAMGNIVRALGLAIELNEIGESAQAEA